MLAVPGAIAEGLGVSCILNDAGTSADTHSRKRQMLRILEPPEARSLASSSRSSLPLSTDGESDIDTDETSRTSEPRSTVERHIDDIFGCGLVSYMAYEPPERPEATGDKLNSNVMVCWTSTQSVSLGADRMAWLTVAFRFASQQRSVGRLPD